jgi:oligopeptide/dipeptide ABC transporter ATP-binding protein
VPSPIAKPDGCSFHTRCPIGQPSCSKEVPEFVRKEGQRFVACPWV